MPFARLNRATTPTSHIGLGLAAVGRPGYITPHRDRDLPGDRGVDALRARTHELLDAAYAQGVRYFDAARSYGRAEEFLAEWLTARPDVTDVVIGSKWGYTYTGDWHVDAETHEVKDHGQATFERQYAETAELLGDRLDLYQIHSLTADSPALSDKDLHARLAELAAGGTTVGFSTSGPGQSDAIRAAVAVTVDGEPLFRTVQATYNALDTSAGAALAEAHDAGLTVIVKEAMANGRLRGDRGARRRPGDRRRGRTGRGRRRPGPGAPPALGRSRPVRRGHRRPARGQSARAAARPGPGAAGPAVRPGGGARGVLAPPGLAALELNGRSVPGTGRRPARAHAQSASASKSARTSPTQGSTLRSRARPGWCAATHAVSRAVISSSTQANGLPSA